jgi:putative phosphoesterase
MKVGVMADSHDRVPAIAELLRRFAAAGAGLVMHAGDYCSPFSLAPFSAASIPLLGVFGRNDGDHEGLREAAAGNVATELYESPHSFEIGGQRIILVHDLSEVMARSVKAHAIVIHGSTHLYEVTTSDSTLLVNPGEACGWVHGACTAALLDLDTKTVERIEL